MASPGYRQASARRSDDWRDTHNQEMTLILALQRSGHTADQARRIAEAHRRRDDPMRDGDNGGPNMTGGC